MPTHYVADERCNYCNFIFTVANRKIRIIQQTIPCLITTTNHVIMLIYNIIIFEILYYTVAQNGHCSSSMTPRFVGKLTHLIVILHIVFYILVRTRFSVNTSVALKIHWPGVLQSHPRYWILITVIVLTVLINWII